MAEETTEVAFVSPQGLVGRLTATGYEPRKGQTMEQWDEDGALLIGIDHAMTWALGDWFVAGGRSFGQDCWQAHAIRSKTLDWWNTVERVSTCVPPENRFVELPWYFHRTVARLDHKEQRRLLEQALD